MAGHPFGCQFPFDHVLSGDACVIRTGDPECGIPLESLAADQEVLDGQVEGMPHVERPGDVGWGDDDRERIAVRIVLRPEYAGSLPPVVPVRLDLLGVVRRFHRSRHSWSGHHRQRCGWTGRTGIGPETREGRRRSVGLTPFLIDRLGPSQPMNPSASALEEVRMNLPCPATVRHGTGVGNHFG